MKNNTYKILVFLSMVFLLLACFLFVFFYRGIKDSHQKSELLETRLQSETMRRNKIEALDRSVKIVEKEKIELETHFAKSSDVVPFLNNIESLAPGAGTLAEVLSVNLTEDKAGLAVVMKATGSFENLYKFLALLENSPYQLEFIGVEFRKEGPFIASDESQVTPRWSATFKMKLLSFVIQ